MTDWAALVGRRVLIQRHNDGLLPEYLRLLYEVRVLEVSPGGRVKLRWQRPVATWELPNLYEVLEALDDSDDK